MTCDLHIHSYYSDGTYSPAEIVKKASELGIGTIAVSDHNTVDAYKNGLVEGAKKAGVNLIASVEIDAASKYGSMHILALGCDTDNKELLSLLESNRDIMDKMSDELIEKMEKDGENVSLEEYSVFERDRRRGGWKGIDYLFTKGMRNDYPYCMTYYKKYGITGYREFEDIKEVCRIIHVSGAKAVLAHPGDRLKDIDGEFLDALEYFKSCGVDGIECYYPSHSEAVTDMCVSFCRKNKMAVTSGSDCHGDFARRINGVEYKLGMPFVDESELDLSGIRRI